MIKRNIKVITALAIVASIGVGAATTHAAAFSKYTTKATSHADKKFKKEKSTNFLKTKFDSLVTAGTITQDQETAALNLFTHKKDGSETRKEKSTNFLKTKLDTLVTAGTIAQNQETAVLDNIKQQETNRKAEMDKVKSMTKAERKAYFQSKKTTEETNFLSSLVTAGTITQDQKTAIESVFTRNKDKDAQAGKEKFTNLLKTKLDTLVNARTITQDQETAMINSLTSSTNKASQN